MLSITIAFVLSVTTNGSALQHQSPSRKTLHGSSFYSYRLVALLPTLIVPSTIIRFFMQSQYPREPLP